MIKIPLPRRLLLLPAALALLMLACGLVTSGNTLTPTPAPTAAPPEPTAVPLAPPVSHDNNGDERQGQDAAVTLAVNRAVSMMAQNAKPTPPPAGGLGGKESASESVTVAATLPPPTAVPQRGAIGLQLDNRASTAACFVYISQPDDTSWGGDRLEASEVIHSGSSRLFELNQGSYDLRVDDCQGKIIYAEFEITVNETVAIQLADRPTPTPGNAPLTVINDLDHTVCYLYVSPSTSDTWGADWLGVGQSLMSDGRTVINVPDDQYDLRAADCNLETVAELYGVSLNRQGYAWVLSGAAARLATFELVNNSTVSVCYVQISPATADTWGPDWLGESELVRAGASRLFELSPDTYDIRALDCDQNTLHEEYGLAIQGTARWTVR